MGRGNLIHPRYDKSIRSVLYMSGRVNAADANHNFWELGNRLFCLGKWKCVAGKKNEIQFYSPNEYIVHINNDQLLTNVEDPSVFNEAGYILVTSFFFHEYRHYHQHTDWTMPDKMKTDAPNILIVGKDFIEDYSFQKAVARRNVAVDHVLSVYTWNYKNDPRELDAEEYRMRYCLKYFETVENPLVDLDTVRQVLFDYATSTDYIHYDRIVKHFPKNINDVIEALHEEKKAAFKERCDISTEECLDDRLRNIKPKEYDITEKLMRDPKYQDHWNAIEKARTGIQMDKIINQVAIMEHPAVMGIKTRIRHELNVTENAIRFARTKTNPYPVIPFHKMISYDIPETDTLDMDILSMADAINFGEQLSNLEAENYGLKL